MNEDYMVERFMGKVEPVLVQIAGTVNGHYVHIRAAQERISALEQDKADLAAIINDYQSLQAQVKTLQFEVARLEYQLEGKAEPSPWK